MKTYCKHLVMSDAKKIAENIGNYLHDKYKKNSTVRFFAFYTGKETGFIRENFRPGEKFWIEAIRKLAEEMAGHIRDRTVREHIIADSGGHVIRYRKIKDKGSGKDRTLGLETILFRLYEAVADVEAEPLWIAKVGTYQVASIKKRGQSYGKKAVKKWMSSDAEKTKYLTKSDIRKCYPSIPHDRLRARLVRDLHKSPELLYLLQTFIDLYEAYPDPESRDKTCGILIGSPVSKDLCNYYLSSAYHFATERLTEERIRRGTTKRKRLISHVIFYADDIILFSGNKKDLKKAQAKMTAYINAELGLDVKTDWTMTRTAYEKDGKRHGNMLDFMGLRFHGGKVAEKIYPRQRVKHRKVWITLRRKIFLAARRKRKRFSNKLRRKQQVSRKFVQSTVSQLGWFKGANMAQYRKKNKIDRLMKIARKIISSYAKEKQYSAEKYYKMWRKYYA